MFCPLSICVCVFASCIVYCLRPTWGMCTAPSLTGPENPGLSYKESCSPCKKSSSSLLSSSSSLNHHCFIIIMINIGPKNPGLSYEEPCSPWTNALQNVIIVTVITTDIITIKVVIIIIIKQFLQNILGEGTNDGQNWSNCWLLWDGYKNIGMLYYSNISL